MNEYFHAWNLVFEGMPKPFWKLIKTIPDLGYAWNNATFESLLGAGLSPELIEKFFHLKNSINPADNFNKVLDAGISIVNNRAAAYPKILRFLNNHLPPAVLYFKGGILLNDPLFISVVGTRRMTGYGEAMTKKIIRDLKDYNVCIVSGMADGVDSVAHLTAIECGMPTIAVLGHGFNHINYYKQKFAEQIQQNGYLLSEYPPDTKGEKYHFPLRNRIISGLSAAVVVVEAGEKSGALITADYALDQGREVFAVPGNVGSEKSAGTNNLIKTSAHLVTKGEDILEVLKIPLHKQKTSLKFTPGQAGIVNILKKTPCCREELIQKTAYHAQDLNMIITELEMEGLITKYRDGKYYLN
ncbi:DNA-processing protein DprA [Candidatus Peregrinibacteria bacterium]|nr:DNA-processing protein DprA [Candidatus Peregrinibacteria bacterium]